MKVPWHQTWNIYVLTKGHSRNAVILFFLACVRHEKNNSNVIYYTIFAHEKT